MAYLRDILILDSTKREFLELLNESDSELTEIHKRSLDEMNQMIKNRLTTFCHEKGVELDIKKYNEFTNTIMAELEEVERSYFLDFYDKLEKWCNNHTSI